jgi:hypothetical protein
MKQHKPWSDEECSKLSDQRKHAKLQWLQNPSHTNRVNVINVKMCNQQNLQAQNEGISERKNQ